jgi:hypothetical protein
MKVMDEPHQAEQNGMSKKGSKIEELGTIMVREGSPKGRSQGCDDTGGAENGTDPEEGLLERIRADMEDIEGKEDIDKIEGESSSKLGERDEDQISMTALLKNHLGSSSTMKILNRSIVDERKRAVKDGLHPL